MKIRNTKLLSKTLYLLHLTLRMIIRAIFGVGRIFLVRGFSLISVQKECGQQPLRVCPLSLPVIDKIPEVDSALFFLI